MCKELDDKKSDFQELVNGILKDPAMLDDLSFGHPKELIFLLEEIAGRKNPQVTAADNELIVELLTNDPMLERSWVTCKTTH